MRNIALLIVAFAATTSRAGNPIFMTNYGADPSAHVFGDRLYVYPSHDRDDAKEFDMTDYHVYSTDDLQNWQDHGVALDVKDVVWGKSHMWAPDCAFKDGTYYLFFCPRPREPFTGRPIGVATAKTPAGPFVAEPKPIDGCNGIDPSVFLDDDGQAYIVWAGKGCQMSKLAPDLKSFDGEPFEVKGLHRFFEGPWLFKREKTYYLTYPASFEGGSGKGGSGQNYAYATAANVTGPYTYQGVFQRTQKGRGNIHGSQVFFAGRWLDFYHDFAMSAGKDHRGFKRDVRCDELEFDKEGNILLVQWSPDGPSQLKPFDPYRMNEAETMNACDVPEGAHAITTATADDPRRVYLTAIDDGDWTRTAGVDFGNGASGVTFTVRAKQSGGAIEVRLDRIDGPLVSTVAVPDTACEWKDATAAVSGAAGKHDLYFVFRGAGLDVDRYQFAAR